MEFANLSIVPVPFKSASTYKSPVETLPVISSMLSFWVFNVALRKVPSKSAPEANFITFSDLVLLKLVIPFTKLVVPAPCISEPDSNVTSPDKLTVPVFDNIAEAANVSSSNDAVPVFVTVSW